LHTGIVTPAEASEMLLAGYGLSQGDCSPEQFIRKLEAVVLAHLIESAEKERLLGLTK
jgi:hypothetical protein